MPLLLVLLCQFIALALLGNDVHSHRPGAVLDLPECGDQGRNIVAVFHKHIVQTHGTEQITLCLAVSIPQQLQIPVQAAVIFRNGHIIVIDNNNKVGVHFAGKVQTFQCLAAAEGAVTDHRNDIAGSAVQIPCLCQTACKANRSGRMPYVKEIVFALLRIGIAGNVVKVFFIQIGIFSAGQHLVRIALMRNVVDDLILRGIEYIMHGNGRFHHAEIRSEVTAVLAQTKQQSLPHFCCQCMHFVYIQFFYIFWWINFFKIHYDSSCS